MALDSGMAERSPQQKLKRLVVLVVQLASVERLATRLGRMAFIWATVVLLGGYVSSLSSTDFLIIACLLLTEGARVSFKSHELELRERNLSLKECFRSLKECFRSIYKRVCGSDERKQGSCVEMGIDAAHIFSCIPPRVMHFVLYFLQLISALVSLGFAIYSLLRHFRRHISAGQQNYAVAVKAFYFLVAIEAFAFLVVRALWEVYVPGLRNSCKSAFQRFMIRTPKREKKDMAMTILKTFVEAVYKSSMKGKDSDRDFPRYIVQKLAGLNESAEQRENLSMLQALCHSEARYKIATRDLITCLFDLITTKYPAEIREEAISLVTHLAEDEHALSIIRLIASDGERIAALVKASYPGPTKKDLVLLGKLAEGEISHVKIQISKDGFEFLMNVMRKDDGPYLEAKQALLNLYWNLPLPDDFAKIFDIFLNENVLRAGELLCIISEFERHKDIIRHLLRSRNGERLKQLLESVTPQEDKGYYSMRILNNVFNRPEHLGAVKGETQKALVDIVKALADVEDDGYLFMGMTLFTSVVDSVELPYSSFLQPTQVARLIDKLVLTRDQILEKINQAPRTLEDRENRDQTLEEISEETSIEVINEELEDGVNAVKSPFGSNEQFLSTLICFYRKLVKMDANFKDDKLAEYLNPKMHLCPRCSVARFV